MEQDNLNSPQAILTQHDLITACTGTGPAHLVNKLQQNGHHVEEHILSDIEWCECFIQGYKAFGKYQESHLKEYMVATSIMIWNELKRQGYVKPENEK